MVVFNVKTEDGRLVRVESFGSRSAIKRVCVSRDTHKRCSEEYREDVEYFENTGWTNMPDRLNPDLEVAR